MFNRKEYLNSNSFHIVDKNTNERLLKGLTEKQATQAILEHQKLQNRRGHNFGIEQD